ncbi:hypothetical protein BV22DRAFT_1128822 [Leucogyrophana mollusca]|uniref:Uncharacterized protein n=1 Tax=Leucogyrophana mollusca TaxID=85980 RepID=A0ACB8BJM0_9AGAM|nr:hypothetical protein BV22DRAFT_1128822 [Leucogyrophana mollusca]
MTLKNHTNPPAEDLSSPPLSPSLPKVSRIQIIQEFSRASLRNIRSGLRRLGPRHLFYGDRWHDRSRVPRPVPPAAKYDDISLLTLDDAWPFTFKPGDKVFVKMDIVLVGRITIPRWYPGVVSKGPINKASSKDVSAPVCRFVYLPGLMATSLVSQPERCIYIVRVGLPEDGEEPHEINEDFCPLDGDIKPDNKQIRDLVSDFRWLEAGWDRKIPFCFSPRPNATLRSSNDPEDPLDTDSDLGNDAVEEHGEAP